MNSSDIVNTIKKYHLKNDRYAIIGGAACVLHGIKEETHDIDISVDKDFIYIMDEKVRGAGGYPTGINGKALVMMSGGIDSDSFSMIHFYDYSFLCFRLHH